MKKIFRKIVLVFCFILMFGFKAFAAKYTMCSGLTFNSRIKASIDIKNDTSTVDTTITGFKRSFDIPSDVTLIDISEDNDSSILAYIKNGIIYYVADDDVYLNKDTSYMFDRFVKINRIDLTEFDYSKCRNMDYMFANCQSLADLSLDNDTLIHPTSIVGMFYNCKSIRDLDIFMIDTKKCTSFKDIFYNCINLRNIQISADCYNKNNVTNFSGMFTNCKSLKTNFGKYAIDIDESLYKTYARPGDDDIEGLLKDYEYEYDDYGEKEKSLKIDSLYEKLPEIQNDIIKADSSSINVKISSDSSLINLSAKNDKKLTDDDVENILISESTYVPDFAKRLEERRKREDAALDYGIEEEETYVSTVSVGQVMRPTPDDWKKMGVEDGREIDKKDNAIKYTTIDQSIIFVFLAIILIILIGLFIHKRNEKKDDKELDDFR